MNSGGDLLQLHRDLGRGPGFYRCIVRSLGLQTARDHRMAFRFVAPWMVERF